MPSYFKPILLSMRPRQWVKNFMVFPALVFSVKIFEPFSLLLSLWTFVVFCLLSGSVYLLNDLADVESDRRHPVKCKRPIPSGALPVRVAQWAVGATLLFALVGAAANLVTVGIAGKNGHQVTFGQFLSYGIPVTIGSMLLASGYILVRYFVFCV